MAPPAGGWYAGYSPYGWGYGQPYYAGWHPAAAAAAAPPPAYTYRDFAQEKPHAYQAFLQYVRPGTNGCDITLSDGMCRDQHISDFLLCLESWFFRESGDPKVSGRPWRLGSLDLSRNSLSDEVVVHALHKLKQLDIRCRQLLLDGNLISTSGLTALTEYVWSCQEAIAEIGIADNSIRVETSGKEEDPVSALLRCLYNHACYPLKARSGEKHDASQTMVTPIVIRLSGNFIADGQKVIDSIVDTVGSKHAIFCASSSPFVSGSDEEFLAAFMEGLCSQRLTKSTAQTSGSSVVEKGVAESKRSAREGAEAGVETAPAAKKKHRRNKSQVPAAGNQGKTEATEGEDQMPAAEHLTKTPTKVQADALPATAAVEVAKEALPAVAPADLSGVLDGVLEGLPGADSEEDMPANGSATKAKGKKRRRKRRVTVAEDKLEAEPEAASAAPPATPEASKVSPSESSTDIADDSPHDASDEETAKGASASKERPPGPATKRRRVRRKKHRQAQSESADEGEANAASAES